MRSPSKFDFAESSRAYETSCPNGEQPFRRSILQFLTPRQRQVCVLAAAGYDNSEIANCLRMKPATVKVHLRSAMNALGACKRTQLVGLLGVARQVISNFRCIKLTPSEEALLIGLSQGFRDSQLAEKLQHSKPAIRAMVRKLRARTGVANRAQLVAWWLVEAEAALPVDDSQIGVLCSSDGNFFLDLDESHMRLNKLQAWYGKPQNQCG